MSGQDDIKNLINLGKAVFGAFSDSPLNDDGSETGEKEEKPLKIRLTNGSLEFRCYCGHEIFADLYRSSPQEAYGRVSIHLEGCDAALKEAKR